MPYGEPEVGADTKYNVGVNVDFGSGRIESMTMTWIPDVSSGLSVTEKDTFFQALVDYLNAFPLAGTVYGYRAENVITPNTPTVI
jgi:hypothetical protein